MGLASDDGPTPTNVPLRVVCLLLCCSLIGCSGGGVASQECQVAACSRQYARARDEGGVAAAASHRHCLLLRAFAECVRNTARACRGDLAYHSAHALLQQWARHFDCARLLQKGPGADKPPPEHRKPPRQGGECSPKGAPAGGGFSHCALFGDPHLRTFSDDLQTCGVRGAWPLLDTPHLAVQVTNEPVGRGSPATAITKITVIIRQHTPCAQEKTYEAQADSLPGVFADGSKWSGPGVRIREETPGRHVEIHLRYISTRIIIRQVGRYLTFAAKMPTSLATAKDPLDTLELCVRGCPRRERIDYERMLEMDSGPKQDAIATCRSLNVTDFYFDACVFDLLTTGDGSFSAAARDAMLDAGINNTMAVMPRGLNSGQSAAQLSVVLYYVLAMIVVIACRVDR